MAECDSTADLPAQRRCADILLVEGPKAEDSIHLLAKHLDSLGAPTWRRTTCGPNHFETMLYTSDRGPDQTKMRRLIPHDITCRRVALFSNDCFDHGTQCVEQGALKPIDKKLKRLQNKWTYYSSCVKYCHTWRGSHVLLYRIILKDVGSEVAKSALYMCPLCDVGRRGAVHGFENKA